MRKNLLLISLILFCAYSFQAFSQNKTTIAEARAMSVGTVVTVTGTVLNGPELGSIRYMQDVTAGIAAYGSTLSNVNRGDIITVTGTLKDYKQLLELDPITNVTVVSTGNPMPPVQIITPSQVGESYESELIGINNGTFSTTGNFAVNVNYNFTSGGQTVIVRVSGASNPLIGTPIPTSTLNLTAICSQYHATDPAAGYQLLLRNAADIPFTTPALSITAPVDSSTISTTNTNIAFIVQNFNVGQNGATGVNGHIRYTLDNGTAVSYFSTTPIPLTGLTVGMHTFNMSLVDTSNNQLNPPVSAIVRFKVDTAIMTIAMARTKPIGTSVTVTGYVTNGAELGAIRYFEDATAGLAAYSATALTNVNRGDEIRVTGTLKNFKQLLELDPVTNVTVLSTGHVVAPQVINPFQIGENYEGELIKIASGTFADSGKFVLNTNYNFTSNGIAVVVRVSGATNPIIGTTIPTIACPLTAICSQYHASDPNAGYQLLVRDASDVTGIKEYNPLVMESVFPNPANNLISISNLNTDILKVEITNIVGQTINSVDSKNQSSLTIDISNLNSGVYFMNLHNQSGIEKTIKFVKQ